jgi:hypothetical protein
MIVGKFLASGGKFFSTALLGLAAGAAGFVALHAGGHGGCCSANAVVDHGSGKAKSCCTAPDRGTSDGVQAAVGNDKENAGNADSEAEGYICPLTGEKLACPNCCPLNK